MLWYTDEAYSRAKDLTVCLSERMNRTLLQMLKTTADDNPATWPANLASDFARMFKLVSCRHVPDKVDGGCPFHRPIAAFSFRKSRKSIRILGRITSMQCMWLMPTHALKFRGLSVCVFVMNASPTKTDEPMEMPFGGGQTRVCPSDRLLDGGAHWRHWANTMDRFVRRRCGL